MMISLIAAISTNKVIGRDNKIPWHISEDFKRFKSLTMGHPIIMGRKTFESIGKPLSGRTNIVITRDESYSPEGVEVVHSIDEALRKAKETWIPDQVRDDNYEVFIIGGGQIYSQSMDLADKLYLTIVEQEVDGDIFFPDYSDFKKVTFEQEGESEGLKYKFVDLEK